MTASQKRLIDAFFINALISAVAALLLAFGLISCANRIDLTKPVDVIPQNANFNCR